MGKYGQIAVLATDFLCEGRIESASDAWKGAARYVFPNQEAAQKKGCPKSTYLGLCEEGLVQHVPRGDYTRSQDNKKYALEAVRLLKGNPGLASDASLLWSSIMKGESKVENSQMDVVLSLWNAGLINQEEI